MIRRKLPIVLFTAAAAAVAVAVPAGSASADSRTLLVTLAGGAQLTVTVDVPPGTPVDQIHIPGVTGVIVSVTDITAPAAPAAPPTVDTTGVLPSTTATSPATTSTTPAPTTTATTPATTTPATTTPTTPSTGAHLPEVKPQGGDPANGPQAKSPRGAQQKATDEAQPEVEGSDAKAKDDKAQQKRADDGSPTPADPTYSLSVPGPAVIGVPNFFIDKFRIPPFLLSIYQAAGIEYGVRWEVLAAINEIETDYGRNLNVSSAGAVGWMQFMPSSWKQYGVDANDDGRKDPYNPVDAIFAAARYLKAAGAATDLRKAIYAYNHADWYVDSVILRARLISGLPADFVGSLTGLTQGRFPVYAKATYADDLSEKASALRIAKGDNAAVPVESSSERRSIDIYAKGGAPVIAVQDGRIVDMGVSDALGKFLKLRDAYGNTYTYAHLGSLAQQIPVPKAKHVSQKAVAKELDLETQPADPAPTEPATAGTHPPGKAKKAAKPANERQTNRARLSSKDRLFANPSRPEALKSGGRDQLIAAGTLNAVSSYKSYFTAPYGLNRKDVRLVNLEVGSKVIAGTILGRLAQAPKGSKSHVAFAIRPAGRGAPRIDPKPILDGWKLLESTAIYRAEGRNALLAPDSDASVGQLLLMSKEQLQTRVLEDPRIEIYDCGRRDIEAGMIDRRVLATLAFLSASGLRPTVSALECGHSFFTDGGNVSEHSSGDAVDIAKINGIPILGHQGDGSITDITVRRLLTLQGAMKPHQIITLYSYPGTDNTLALADHADHIHVGFQPLDGANAVKFQSVLKPGQWTRLVDRLSHLANPEVPLQPSQYALPVKSGNDG
jgi:murein DD-endopeptidase MepM/ murein hydrolase activator NlpD